MPRSRNTPDILTPAMTDVPRPRRPSLSPSPRWVLTLSLLIVGFASSSASAVSITQRPLPAGALLQAPEALFADAGGVFIAGTTGTGFAPVNLTSASPTLLTGVPGPEVQRGLVRGPEGNLWYLSAKEVAGKSLETICVAAASGVVVRYVYPSNSEQPVDIVVGPDGALWLPDVGLNVVDRFDPTTNTMTSFPVPRGVSFMALGADGAFWFPMRFSSIGRLTTTGELTEYPLPDNVAPYDIVAGPDGALWFTEWEAGTIGRITTAGAYQAFPIVPAVPLTSSTRLTPMSLTVGPERAIWFTDPGDNAIGRLLGSQGTEYAMPAVSGSPQAIPKSIVTAPDGSLYVSEENAKAIARVDPNGSPPPAAVPGSAAPLSLCARQLRSARLRRHLSRAHLTKCRAARRHHHLSP